MTDKDTLAFPTFANNAHAMNQDGMTLRQYAAIKLKLPDSGTDWLDAMIVKSLRDEFAARAMQAFAGLSDGYTSNPNQYKPRLADSYSWADAMIEARKGNAS